MHSPVALPIPLTDPLHHPCQPSLQTSSNRLSSEEASHHPSGPMKGFCTTLTLVPLLPGRDRNKKPSFHVPMDRSPATLHPPPPHPVVQTRPNGRATTDSCGRTSHSLPSQMQSNECFRLPLPPPPLPPPPPPPMTRLENRAYRAARASSHRRWLTTPCEGVLARQRLPLPTSTRYLFKTRESRRLVNQSFQARECVRPHNRSLREGHRPPRPFAQFPPPALTGLLSLRLVDIARLALRLGDLSRR